MKSSWPILAAAALAVHLAGNALPAAAQENETFPVAILNLDILFQESKEVSDATAKLKEEAAEIDKTLQLRQAEIESVQAELRKVEPGSAEFRKHQQEVFKLSAELQQFLARERANLQLKEAKIYLAAYRDVEEVVKEYCKEKGIKLVIRQQKTSLDENQPAQEIVKALNRVVIHEEGLDITAEIQKRMNAKEEKPK